MVFKMIIFEFSWINIRLTNSTLRDHWNVGYVSWMNHHFHPRTEKISWQKSRLLRLVLFLNFHEYKGFKNSNQDPNILFPFIKCGKMYEWMRSFFKCLHCVILLRSLDLRSIHPTTADMFELMYNNVYTIIKEPKIITVKSSKWNADKANIFRRKIPESIKREEKWIKEEEEKNSTVNGRLL